MGILRVIGYSALHLVPKTTLALWLVRGLSRPGYIFSPRFSGRSALFELASTLRQNATAPIALAPDYICNIVPRALAEAGWTVEFYSCDERLESDWSELLRRIEYGDVGLLLGASVFGSSGLLNDLSDNGKLRRLREMGVKIIVDLAQDIRLIDRLPAHGSDMISCIVSFNDKSFPGAMGGGILSNVAISKNENMAVGDLVALYRRTVLSNLGKYIRRFRNKRGDEGGFDYSQCAVFPFRLRDNYGISKLQIIAAVQGLSLIRRYEIAKKRFLDEDYHLDTCFSSTAAYLIVSRDDVHAPGRRRKKPYALEKNSEVSLRPDHWILHNKGFDDFD